MNSNIQVMELSDNLKLRRDQVASESQGDRIATPRSEADDSAHFDDAESQMRKALGLLGEAPRHRPEPERTEVPHRMADRFGGGLHRRRFVQDGDVPVTVLRRDQGHEAPPQRVINPALPPTSSRLQRLESQLAAETAAREKAERALAEAHAVIRDLQTKIGHAELARTEAVEALRREREAAAQIRQDASAWEEQAQEARGEARKAEQALHAVQEQLTEEQRARRAAEKALKAAEAVRESAERLTQAAQDAEPAAPEWTPPAPARRLSANASISPAIRRRRAAEPSVADQEPVKWWLNAKQTSKRR